MKFSKLAILGPGLLGGSIALAARRKHLAEEVVLWARRQGAIDEVRAAGIDCRATTDLRTAAEGAEFVVLCTPVGAMPALAERIREFLDAEAIVTDVGSVKSAVAGPLFAILGRRFVGSHPMAGSERSGVGAARADLFEGAACMVTPHAQADPAVNDRVVAFWERLGCRVHALTAERHDEIVAHVSHLPHLVAAALVNLVCSRVPNPVNFCGNGLRDTTRIAAGPVEMWAEILRENRGNLREAIQGLVGQLQTAERLLAGENDEPIQEFLRAAKAGRESIKSSARGNQS